MTQRVGEMGAISDDEELGPAFEPKLGAAYYLRILGEDTSLQTQCYLA